MKYIERSLVFPYKVTSYNKYSYKVEIMDEPSTTTTWELKQEDEGDD